MFDISTRLVSEQDEISGLETIGWENHSWKYLSLIGDERVINLQRTKVYVFSDSCVVSWEDSRKLPMERCMGTKIGMVKIILKITETLTESTASQWNSSGIFSQGFNTLQLSEEVKRLLLRLDGHQRISQEASYLCVDVQ